MFGPQVRNQSVEKGSMPLGGEMPRTSLYNRSRRPRLRSVSVSRTCRRAPSSIRFTASCTCCILATRLFSEDSMFASSSGVGRSAGHQQGGMRLHHCRIALLADDLLHLVGILE